MFRKTRSDDDTGVNPGVGHKVNNEQDKKMLDLPIPGNPNEDIKEVEPYEVLSYLCSPYTDRDRSKMKAKAERNVLAGLLMATKSFVLVPLMHSVPHPGWNDNPERADNNNKIFPTLEQMANYWRTHSSILAARADLLAVHMQPGWDKSVGVRDEIDAYEKYAKNPNALFFFKDEYIENPQDFNEDFDLFMDKFYPKTKKAKLMVPGNTSIASDMSKQLTLKNTASIMDVYFKNIK